MKPHLKIKWQYLAVLFVGIVAGVYLAMSWPAKPAGAKVVTIVGRGGLSFEVTSHAEKVQGLLAEQGIAEDRIYSEPAPDAPLQSGQVVTYRLPVNLTVLDGGQKKTVVTTAQTVGEALLEDQISLNAKDELSPGIGTEVYSGMQIVIRRVTEAEETVTEAVPFTTVEQGDAEILYGSETVVQPGHAGSQEVVYLVRYRNGKEIARKKLSSRMISEPVSQIVKLGRKIVVESLEQGMGSWYAYKKCMCAAHPYYPKGSYLRVTNIANGKTVIVRVNDWGPDQAVHMNRIIDLDAEAFKLLAPLSLGTIEVKVEKLKTGE
jgi:uncharacterized protein YabE (DUF348 family)